MDYTELTIDKVLCKRCKKVFLLEEEADLFWIVSTDNPPWVRCKQCYSHPDNIMEEGNETVIIDYGDLFDSLCE